MMTKNMETRWYYHGPDDKVYGPYESRDMILWYQSGYFNDALLVRTEHEDRFHTIGEYVRVCGGKLPFHLPIHSMEHIISQLQHPPIRGPINPAHMMLPPGRPPPFPPPTTQQIRFPFVPAMGGPMHPGMTPNGAPYNLSQPPSEPQDGGPSASQTPDSENEFNNAERPRLMNGIHVGIQVPYSQIPKATIGTDPVVFPRSDASTQTMPLILPPDFYNVTLSYYKDSDYFVPYDSFERIGKNDDASDVWTEQQIRVAVRKKTSGSLLISSNCKTPSNREEYIKALRRYHNFTILGKCGDGRQTCDEKCEGNVIEKHHFYLALENTVCEEYTSEKAFRRMKQLLVPVVLHR